ncbi:MAG: hypothetical protein JRG91_12790 [Deltaproteobacteria bacterium]|nr:hypothetical protein [Deltaproteobacteria bacterium]
MRAPWTSTLLDRLVEKAVRFIREAEKRHASEFALEVGGHIFNGIFKGSRELYGRKGAWGRDSLTCIVQDDDVEISLDQLYMCIHYYVLTKVYRGQRRKAEPPALTPWKWDRLWVLEKNPGALVELADWGAREKISLRLLLAVARIVEPFLAAGGRLDDLLVGAPDEPSRDSPYKRMARILGVVERWVESNASKYPPHVRRRMIAQIDKMLAMLPA